MRELLPEPNEFSKKADNNKEWADYITAYSNSPSNYIKDREAILANYKHVYKFEFVINIKFDLQLFVFIVNYCLKIEHMKSIGASSG